MFTSRAEFRLLLRQDNADLRLSGYGEEKGLVSRLEMDRLEQKQQQIQALHQLVIKKNMAPKLFNKSFSKRSTALKQAERLVTLARRPEINLNELLNLSDLNNFGPEAIQEVAFSIKYEGYIKRNQALVDRFYQYENKKIPNTFNYSNIEALSAEGREKLAKIKPESFGQASRISGVSPADLSILLIYMEKAKYQKKVSRETSV
jgi:tRNA uridine 5-carboxymethylaminomethyl modification enzyme